MTDAAPTRACRGWPLVRALGRLSPAEQVAAEGHLAICRHCSARLDAARRLEQRVATAGSATFAVSVFAALTRALGKAAAAPLTGSSLTPVVALTTAAAVTAGAGGYVVSARDHTVPRHPPVVTTAVPDTTTGPAAHGASTGSPSPPALAVVPTSRARPASTSTAPGNAAPGNAAPGNAAPGGAAPGVVSVPTATGVSVPLPSATSLPATVPLPAVSLPAPAPAPVQIPSALPTGATTLPLPLATLTAPALTP